MSGLNYIYAIADGDSWRCKIGIAKCPESRLRQLQTGNASYLQLVYAEGCKDRKMAERCEALCHAFLCEDRIRGEWFKINPQLAALLIAASVAIPDDMEAYIGSRKI